jgi:hypothetical protein
MHKRAEIKNAVVSILTAQVKGQYQTIAGVNVFKSRFVPLEEAELPCVCVYAVTETSEKFDNIRLKRTLDLAVDCISTSSSPDDMIDSLTNQVEYLLIADVTVGGNASWIELKRTEIGPADQSKNETLAGKMVYEITYYTDITADPGTAMFNTIDINYENKNGKEAEDLINLPH